MTTHSEAAKEAINDDVSESGSETSVQNEETFRRLSKVILYLEEKGLPVKNASYGKVRNEYVRGEDLVKAIKENIEYVTGEINKICETQIDAKSEEASQQIYEEFNEREMMVKAIRFKDDKMKYPKRLAHFEEELELLPEKKNKKIDVEPKKEKISDEEMGRLDEKFFYILDIHRDKKKVYFWLFLIIFLVLMYCLFPVWPVEVKIGIWWVSYLILAFLISLIVLRLVLHYFFYVFGIDFWFFPDLLNEQLGVLDSFKAIYSVNKRVETKYTVAIRIVCSAVVLYLAWIVYENPESVNDFLVHISDIYSDTFEYGKDQVISYGNATAISLKNPKYLNPLMDEEDDDFY